MVDTLAHCCGKEELQQILCYGQLQHIFWLNLPPASVVNKTREPKTVLLALIYKAPITTECTYQYLVTSYEGELSSGEVVDASTIACAVSRVKDKKCWWIVDWSSRLGNIEFVD
jgi:hypothetical protein